MHFELAFALILINSLLFAEPDLSYYTDSDAAENQLLVSEEQMDSVYFENKHAFSLKNNYYQRDTTKSYTFKSDFLYKQAKAGFYYKDQFNTHLQYHNQFLALDFNAHNTLLIGDFSPRIGTGLLFNQNRYQTISSVNTPFAFSNTIKPQRSLLLSNKYQGVVFSGSYQKLSYMLFSSIQMFPFQEENFMITEVDYSKPANLTNREGMTESINSVSLAFNNANISAYFMPGYQSFDRNFLDERISKNNLYHLLGIKYGNPYANVWFERAEIFSKEAFQTGLNLCSDNFSQTLTHIRTNDFFRSFRKTAFTPEKLDSDIRIWNYSALFKQVKWKGKIIVEQEERVKTDLINGLPLRKITFSPVIDFVNNQDVYTVGGLSRYFEEYKELNSLSKNYNFSLNSLHLSWNRKMAAQSGFRFGLVGQQLRCLNGHYKTRSILFYNQIHTEVLGNYISVEVSSWKNGSPLYKVSSSSSNAPTLEEVSGDGVELDLSLKRKVFKHLNLQASASEKLTLNNYITSFSVSVDWKD